MLRGLTTISFFADDVPAARDWYAKLLGTEAYFVRPVEGPPAYVEFRFGDYQHELGIIDSRYSPHGRSERIGGTVVYWYVDDVQASLDHLLSLGATLHEKPVVRGPGYVTASVVDPFGNIIGVMENEHYLEVLRSRTPAGDPDERADDSEKRSGER